MKIHKSAAVGASTYESIAYKAGKEAKRQGVRLQDSAVSKLKVGSRQYEDFIAGYDGKEYSHGKDHD
jgi:hypothetical protein